MVKGSCLCGAIAFELDPGGIVASVGCYCSNCRKVSGAEGRDYLQVKRGAFRWTSGEDDVGSFESSPGNRRGFCRRCGCVAPIAAAYGAVRVPAGLLDEDPDVRPAVTLFASRRAGWCDPGAGADRFDDVGPPEFWQTMIMRLHAPG
jgi:hypothetical protein